MAKVKLTVDKKIYQADEGENLLSFLLKKGFSIPHLCFHPDFEPEQSCRLCLVEVDGKITPSCSVKIKEGLNVMTCSPKIEKLRKINCLILSLAKNRKKERKKFILQNIICFDPSKCIDCGLCIKTCQSQNIEAVEFQNYGIKQEIVYKNNPCVACGQCLVHCPVGAIYTDENEYQRIKKNIKERKIKIAQIAPSVRASIGELFGISYEEVCPETLVAGLKKAGFDYVFDTAFAADITTVEEAKELVERIKENKNLPMLTSCCPAWVNYVLTYKPHLKKHLTTVVPPEIKMGNFIKHYFAKKMKFDLDSVYVVSIMPCTAKKWEVKRKEFVVDGYYPVDDSLTTVEIGRLLKEEGIDLKKIKKLPFDSPLGEASGAGVIYGTTGGVMTSALRTAYFYLTGENPADLYFEEEITHFEGVKVFQLKKFNNLKIAVVNGLGNFAKIEKSLKEFHYVEVMACPGGCLAGGGQPKPVNEEIRKKRQSVLLRIDKNKKERLAHENPLVKKIYREFLTDEKKAHKYCHCHF